MNRARLRAAWLGVFCAAVLLPSVSFGQGWIISGVVQDDMGVGIVGADIDIFTTPAPGVALDLSNDTTGVNGAFALTINDLIPGGNYTFVVSGPAGSNYFSVTQTLLIFGPTTVPATVLPQGWFVSGRVVDAQGTGLAGVDLDFIDSSGTPFAASGDLTDAAGNFSVLVPPETYGIGVAATVATPGGPYVPLFIEDVPVLASIPLGDLTLHVGHSFSGFVQASGGAPIVGADIDVLDPVTGVEIFTPDDFTDGTGAFQFLAPAGTWTIEVDPPTGLILVPQLITFTIAPAPAVNNLGVVTLQPGVVVSGVTVDGGAVPVPDVDLDFVQTVTQLEIVTVHDNANGSGSFSVVVQPDTYDILYRPPFATGLAPLVQTAVVVNGSINIGNVVLSPGFAFTGTVTANGQPVAGVEVTVTDSGTGNPVYTFGNDTDLLGNYGLRQLPGTYDLLFTPLLGSGLQSLSVPGLVLNGDLVVNANLVGAPLAPPPVTGLSCLDSGSDALLTWTNAALDYDSIDIRRDGQLLTSLAGDVEQYSDLALADATYSYNVIPVRGALSATAGTCSVTISTVVVTTFTRGDTNADGSVNLADSVAILTYLFSGGTIACLDSGDTNDDGAINIADAVFLLGYLFSGGAEPPVPFTTPGMDPTPDMLPCL